MKKIKKDALITIEDTLNRLEKKWQDRQLRWQALASRSFFPKPPDSINTQLFEATTENLSKDDKKEFGSS